MNRAKATAPTSLAGPRFARHWLFSPALDVSIWAIPLFVTAFAFLLARGTEFAKPYAMWLTQFVLGNTTHVILTFLMLATRRDLLRATKRNAPVVVAGSLVTFGVSFAFFWVTNRVVPRFADFGVSVVFVFAMHHTLSQAKGIWALYNLRSQHAGFKFDPLERRVQQAWVPIGLVLILVRVLFVPKEFGRVFAFFQVSPGEPAILPYPTTYLLLGAWCAYCVVALAVLGRRTQGGPKVAYLATQLFATGLTIATPGWGLLLSAGIHGLEYYLLSHRMLTAKAGEPGVRTRSSVASLMAIAMMPLVCVGILNAPFSDAMHLPVGENVALTLRLALNAIVMAHYFADGFLYRFRDPDIRRTTLARLDFPS